MKASPFRRFAWPNKLQQRSLFLFGAGLALQCVILLSTVPGTAQQIDPVDPPLCFANCPSISVESTANVLVFQGYTTTYTIDYNPITKTLFVGGLDRGAEFGKVDANQGLVLVQSPVTYSVAVAEPFPPLVITTTVQATDTGIHRQTLGHNITTTNVADVETATSVTDLPLPFTVNYKIPALASVGVITETYSLLPSSNVVTKTLVAGEISSLVGRYRSIVGSGASICESADLRFSCDVPSGPGFPTPAITITLEVQQPGQLVRGLQVSGGGTTLPLSFASRTHPIQTVIDIKPGGHPNTIRVGKPHNIAVAILSNPQFPAADRVDGPTLRFGPTGSETGPTSCAPEYSNGDTLLDLVCHFDGPKAGFQPGDTVGRLSGKTLPSASFPSGLPLAAQDSVRIIAPGQGSSPN